MNIKTVLALTAALTSLNGFTATNEATMLGFARDAEAKERTLESQFDTSIRRENLRDWMKRITARPHHLGSPYDKENAEFIAAQFRSWGYDTQIEEFQVLF